VNEQNEIMSRGENWEKFGEKTNENLLPEGTAAKSVGGQSAVHHSKNTLSAFFENNCRNRNGLFAFAIC
jgi:hypothetical protein